MKLPFKSISHVIQHIRGWMEYSFSNTPDYRYFMTEIKLVQESQQLYTLITYKLVGSRVIYRERTTELNKSDVFSLFRKDQAQMIVSIATLEAIITLDPTEILRKYKDYVEVCIAKVNQRDLI